MKKNGILFLTLNVFSETGGIEKVCRVAGKALFEIARQCEQRFNVFAMHDEAAHRNESYFPCKNFKAFSANRSHFTISGVITGTRYKIVILSHVNLLSVGYFIKLLSPKTKLVLIAHGIEVWKPLSRWKKKMLNSIDLILPVSRFTKEKMKALHQIKEEKFAILNNSLDPFLPAPPLQEQTAALRHKYGFSDDDFVILTLSRLTGKEKNKGYDKILYAQAQLIKEYPGIRYLFVGKYDKVEKSRLDNLIAGYGLTGSVIFAGFVPDAELAVHYSIADVYVMPSEKEGFGISFIEAIYYGIPVIAGNRDGTVDALCDGKLGTLIDPRNQDEITYAIRKVIENKVGFVPYRELMLENFSYDVYKKKLEKILALFNNS